MTLTLAKQNSANLNEDVATLESTIRGYIRRFSSVWIRRAKAGGSWLSTKKFTRIAEPGDPFGAPHIR